MKAVALLLAALWAIPTVSADWLQDGGDAGGSNYLSDAGPDWPDVALSLPPPPSMRWGVQFWGGQLVLIIGQHIFAAAQALDASAPDALYRIDLETGASENWIETGDVFSLASDGTFLFLAEGMRGPTSRPQPSQVRAIRIADAATAWTQPLVHARLPKPTASVGLGDARLAHDAGALYVSFISTSFQAAGAWTVLRLNATTGDVAWHWEPDAHATEPNPNNLIGPPPPAVLSWLQTPTVAAGRVLIIRVNGENRVPDGQTEAGTVYWAGWALNATTGKPDAGDPTSPQLTGPGHFGHGPFTVASIPNPPTIHLPQRVATRNGILVYNQPWVVRDELMTISQPDTAPIEVNPSGTGQFMLLSEGDGQQTAVDDSFAFVASNTKIVGFAHDLSATWTQAAPQGQLFRMGRLLSDGDTLYATSRDPGGVQCNRFLHAYDAFTGQPRWSWRAPRQFCSVAGADGLLVGMGEERVHVIGQTALSPKVVAAASTTYPETTALVHVDLSGSMPGIQGAVSHYRVLWGDGSDSGWQEDPRLEHRFTALGDAHARFMVRNQAGQTASLVTTFQVGERDPSITIWNSPFNDEYQETSFFLLGLVATAAVALFGIARAGRKRRRFHAELRRLEEGYNRLAMDTKASDAMLGESKSRARAFFLEKKLEEAHASFLERRVDELRRGLRLGTIEEKLAFLPYGMVANLQRLLADARVDEWERNHFLAALAKQKELSATQRALARKIIDEWFARDAGG